MEKVLRYLLSLGLLVLLTGCVSQNSTPADTTAPTEESLFIDEDSLHALGSSAGDLTVWSTYWDCADDVPEILSHADSIRTASLFAAYFQDDGLYIPEITLENLGALRDSGWDKEVYLSVVNDVVRDGVSTQKDTDILWELLSPDRFASHAEELIAAARDNGFDGIEIDYEKIRKDLALWEQFFRFEEQLIALARDAGLGVRIILEPGTPVDALTFPQGAQYVVMCYNLCGGGTGPGPKATFAFLQELYNRFRVLPNISFALANGGFDWMDSSTKPASLLSTQAAALAQSHGVLPRRDSNSGALHFRYAEAGTWHTVWYADSVTLALWARELGECAGSPVSVSLWRL